MCRKSSLHSLRKRPRTGAFCNISPESSRIALMNWISQMDASTASRFRLSDSSDTRRPHGARRSQSRETPMSARACVRGDAVRRGDGELVFTRCHSRQMASSGAEHVPSEMAGEMDAHSERAKWAHLPARARRVGVRKERKNQPARLFGRTQADSRSTRSSRPSLAANLTS